MIHKLVYGSFYLDLDKETFFAFKSNFNSKFAHTLCAFKPFQYSFHFETMVSISCSIQHCAKCWLLIFHTNVLLFACVLNHLLYIYVQWYTIHVFFCILYHMSYYCYIWCMWAGVGSIMQVMMGLCLLFPMLTLAHRLQQYLAILILVYKKYYISYSWILYHTIVL